MPRIHLYSLFAAAVFISHCAIAAANGQEPVAGLSADCSAYASVSLPAEAAQAPAPKTPPSCASYRSYRGIGRPANYAEARACAWQERLAQKADLGQNQAEPTAWVVGGSLILADIYFNGAGIKRNVPLALRLACEAEEGMVSLAVPEIKKLSSSSGPDRRFEFCDYAATTFTMNFCTGYESEIEEERRNRFYNSLKSSMTPQQTAAYEKLMAAREAYIEAHGSEVDQGGTIRTMRTIGSQNILEDLFRTELVHFEQKKWPALTEKQLVSADALLVREYNNKVQQLRRKTKDEIDQGGVTADDLAKVQASWEKYRDAWVAFAVVRYPAEAHAIRAEITLDRYRLLRTID
jgi:uncharacterized protein YecT (DUF1311 family)